MIHTAPHNLGNSLAESGSFTKSLAEFESFIAVTTSATNCVRCTSGIRFIVDT
jgi:hypothetical protein